MQEIIAVNKTIINGAEENSVNSREIYEYLEVNTAYSMWIQRAIEKYDFIPNEDYIEITTDTKSGKRDYIVTLDMAKELCMVSNTTKGKETRKYFIAIEKDKSKPMTQLEMIIASAQLQQQQAERISLVEEKLEEVSRIPDMVKEATQLAINSTTRETAPKDGYYPVKVFENRYGMSKQVVKKIANAFDPRTCECTRFVESVGISDYTAYNRKDMDKAFKQIKKTAVAISDCYYKSEFINGRFQCNAIDI